MKSFKKSLAALMLVASVVLGASAAFGKAEYAKKEKQKCSYCHSKATGNTKEEPNLNDTGKCYKKNNLSLATCTPSK